MLESCGISLVFFVVKSDVFESPNFNVFASDADVVGVDVAVTLKEF